MIAVRRDNRQWSLVTGFSKLGVFREEVRVNNLEVQARSKETPSDPNSDLRNMKEKTFQLRCLHGKWHPQRKPGFS